MGKSISSERGDFPDPQDGTLTVTRPHHCEFATAPRAKRGEVVEFERVDPNNAAWFYGRDARGVPGYFPVDWFDRDPTGNSARARRDYDATELTVAIGMSLHVAERYGRWVLGTTPTGTMGWIPEECLG